MADDVLRQGVQGISDLITVHGLINLDFADVKAVMSNAGSALMGIGRASGENRAVEAAKQAVESPLLEISIDGARGILFNVIGGNDMAMHEINAAAETITAASDPQANIIFGATINPELEGEIIITVVATGFDDSYYNRASSAPSTVFAAPLVKDDSSDDHVVSTSIDSKTIESLDMDLDSESNSDDKEDFSDLSKEVSPSNIWGSDDADNDDAHEHLLGRSKVIGSMEDDSKKSPSEDHSKKTHTDDDAQKTEDELDKPSFLRRFKRNKKEKDQEKTDTK